MFESLQHFGYILKLLFGLCQIITQYVIRTIQVAFFTLVFFRKRNIIANINIHAIIINWILNHPMKGFGTIFFLLNTLQTTVRNIRQVSRNVYTNFHSLVNFIIHMVFVGPPNTGSQTLTRGGDKWISIFIFFPSNPSIPRWIYSYFWFSAIKHHDFFGSTYFLRSC